ncbi:MAG: hypothetical protein CBC48_10150 [bacterium TMED88]|nr:hypothetical protein [Deltaproteobacteria bacterium]OUV30832.1 MAG: hypothetical protein CBC48_10150 [bacterium TMED88]
MKTMTVQVKLFFALLSLSIPVLGSVGCSDRTAEYQEFFERGNAYQAEGRDSEAIIEYRNALQADPNQAAAHEALARSYLNAEQAEKAFWELAETVRLDPDNTEARQTFAAMALAAGQNDLLLEQAEAIVGLEPDNPEGQLLLGQAYLVTGQPDKAEAPLRRAIELAPDIGASYAVLSALYASQGDYDQSEALLREAIEVEPQIEMWNLLVEQFLSQGKEEEAEEALKAALEWSLTRFDEEKLEADSDSDAAVTYVALALFYLQREREDEAVALLQEGIARVPGEILVVQALANYYRVEGEGEKADELIEQAAAIDESNPEPLLLVSAVRARAGDAEGAIEFAEKALLADPGSVEARLRKAEILIDTGARSKDSERLAEGKAIVDEVLSEDQTNPPAQIVLAKYELVQGNPQGAIESARSALDAQPNWSQGHFIIGSAYLALGDQRRARGELARAVELDSRLSDAQRLLIKVHLDLGEYEYAIENGEKYLRNRPEDDQTRIRVAQSYIGLGQFDQAAAVLDEIPEERQSVEVLLGKGRLASARGDREAGRKHVEAAEALEPSDPRVLELLFVLDREEGKVQDSVRKVNRARELDPNNAGLARLQGVIALSENQPELAEKSFRRAIELDPMNSGPYGALGNLYIRSGRNDEAFGLYQRLTEIQPENAAAQYSLGVLSEGRGKSSEAISHYQTAIEIEPSYSLAKNNLAYLLADTGGDLDTALKLAQEAKAEMPDSPSASDTLGWVLYKRGVSSAAIGYLREAVRMTDEDEPARGGVYYHLALAYEGAGKSEAASEAYSSALEHVKRHRAQGTLSADPDWAENARANLGAIQNAS